MRVFLIASAVPHRRGGGDGVTAVHIVLYELLRGLAALGNQIVLQVIFNPHRLDEELSPAEASELQHLGELVVKVLPPVFPSEYVKKARPASAAGRLGRLVRLLSGRVRLEDAYPAISLREVVSGRVRSSGSDVVLTVWSPEGLAATYGLREPPTIAYQGDVDFIPGEARMQDRGLFFGGSDPRDGGIMRRELDALRRRLGLIEMRRAHFQLMRDADVVANVTASNAEIYRGRAHPRSIYIRNTWTDVGLSDPAGSGWGIRAPDRPVKIIGHVGYLNRTGSTFGLKFLLVELMPALSEVMGGLDYRVHVIGGGDIVRGLRPWLQHERVVVRGFVVDLEGELRSSDVMLLLNNAGPYQAAYTRHLVAWSMGLCLVVHANSVKAIPEIVHMENALVGTTPAEIARMIFTAATDRDLNTRIRHGGRATYEKYFTPLAVADALNREMLSLVGAASSACAPIS